MITQDGHSNGNYADLDYTGMHEFTNCDNEAFGSFEVFQGKDYCDENNELGDGEINPYSFYWWACFAGCLPDGDPIGPFTTSAEAYHDAQGF